MFYRDVGVVQQRRTRKIKNALEVQIQRSVIEF